MSLEQCKMKCTNECNCTPYTTLDIKQGTGCLVWYYELIDMRVIRVKRQDIYIKMSTAELEEGGYGARENSDSIIQRDGLDLALFNLSTLTIATDNFSINNRLGKGGFGLVYKVLFNPQASFLHITLIRNDLKAF
ncbi:putative non-specific serine/threonine protein kinase [Helianthus annuus]|nr:putative non-specific serine/threonine protein kinase [Helianthus annuus]